jgi:hypothetical protein
MEILVPYSKAKKVPNHNDDFLSILVNWMKDKTNELKIGIRMYSCNTKP